MRTITSTIAAVAAIALNFVATTSFAQPVMNMTAATQSNVIEVGQKCRQKQAHLHDPCGPAPNTQYGGGGHNPKTVLVKACLPNNLYEAIKLKDGSAWWDFGLYYGNGQPEEVATIHGQCRTQNVAVGTSIVAYINCLPTYKGWVYVKVSQGGSFTFKKGYPFRSAAHDPVG